MIYANVFGQFFRSSSFSINPRIVLYQHDSAFLALSRPSIPLIIHYPRPSIFIHPFLLYLHSSHPSIILIPPFLSPLSSPTHPLPSMGQPKYFHPTPRHHPVTPYRPPCRYVRTIIVYEHCRLCTNIVEIANNTTESYSSSHFLNRLSAGR